MPNIKGLSPDALSTFCLMGDGLTHTPAPAPKLGT